ncbi:MAG: Survival protein SurA precursor (Peptidyl-prolyl cis-trans isomerase SurA) [Cytophagales bacterium]|jgi:peptidyl-prolyl cis-trans isomerase SurA|nr:peptidylprolyl isomerase [Bacteroidota bacterium]MBS1979905.1 peptidylprolyl isomerase [Bacteroidota bacterium]WHZ07350.1 MAG: Survival protein SurA precursor (Peptidyl-prolyl cis-trans isomerase SurA) [Cytophagales bacterium]
MVRYLFIFVLCGFTGIGWGQPKKTKPAVLFTLAGSATSTDEFIYLFKKNHPNGQNFTKEKVDDYLTLFINFKLKVREAHELGLDTTEKYKKELATYREELKKPYRTNKDLLDKLTREAYEHLSKEIKASHILIQVKPEDLPEDTLKAYTRTEEIRKRILAGESFEKLARELSEDPSARYNGGNLNYFTALQMVYPFEEAAYNTPVGKISPVVRTRFGYHLISVEDVRPSRGEVEVSHILLRAAKDDAKAKNTIFEIYDQLKSGRSWDELCAHYSEDTNTKNNGGRLKPFGIGVYASVPEFENTAFVLQKPGDISDPFQSAIGWHIIRLEKKIPLAPYVQIEPTLKKKVARDERVKISEVAVALQRKKEFGFVENISNKNAILTTADSSLQKGKWKYRGSADSKKLTLFLLQGKKYEAGAFIAWAEGHQKTNKLSPSDYLRHLYISFVDENVDLLEEEKIVKNNPDFTYLLSEYREGILLFDVMEKEIWNKASSDTLGLRKFYEEHLSNYSAGARVEARLFSTSDKTFYEEIKKKIYKGDTLKATDLKKFKSVQNFRNYEKGESKVIDKINWVPGMQDTELDNTYYFVDIKQLVAPGTKTFAEARSRVISDYQDSLEKNWVISLKNKYPVSVNRSGKKIVESELIKK